MTNKEKNEKFVIVSPDEGAIKRTLKFAGFLQLQNYEFCHKQRIFDKPGIVDDMKLLNICNLKDKTAIICDDIVDSGGTLMKCINLLIKNGKTHWVSFILIPSSALTILGGYFFVSEYGYFIGALNGGVIYGFALLATWILVNNLLHNEASTK